MKAWHRVASFFIFIAICIAGISSLDRLANYTRLSLVLEKSGQLPTCEEAETKFINGFGYWKDIYKAYHLLAYLEYKKGNFAVARSFLFKALHYHPYYPNGYKMLGFLSGRHTPQGKACYKAYQTIMEEGSRPEKHLVDLCFSGEKFDSR